jgi:hypothetical protein
MQHGNARSTRDCALQQNGILEIHFTIIHPYLRLPLHHDTMQHLRTRRRRQSEPGILKHSAKGFLQRRFELRTPYNKRRTLVMLRGRAKRKHGGGLHKSNSVVHKQCQWLGLGRHCPIILLAGGRIMLGLNSGVGLQQILQQMLLGNRRQPAFLQIVAGCGTLLL